MKTKIFSKKLNEEIWLVDNREDWDNLSQPVYHKGEIAILDKNRRFVREGLSQVNLVKKIFNGEIVGFQKAPKFKKKKR